MLFLLDFIIAVTSVTGINKFGNEQLILVSTQTLLGKTECRQTLPNNEATSHQNSRTEVIHHTAVLQNELESVHVLDWVCKGQLREIATARAL